MFQTTTSHTERRAGRVARLAAVALFVLAASLAPAEQFTTASLSAELNTILGQFPAPSTTSGVALCKELVAAGPKAMEDICKLVVPMGKGDDAQARYAISAMVFYTTRPGAEKERKAFALTLVKTLESTQEKEVKSFCMEQLQLCGKGEAVEAISKYVADADLSDYAVRALVRINPPGLAKTLLKALPQVEGRNRQEIMLALGNLRAKEAIPTLKEMAKQDGDMQLSALDALAAMGAAPTNLLEEVNKAKSDYVKGRLLAAHFRQLKEMAKAGKKDEAAKICRSVMVPIYENEGHIQSSSLAVLAEILGAQALDDLLKAAASPNPQVRNAALELGRQMAGKQVTEKYVKLLSELGPEARADLVAMLGRRGDAAALPALVEALKAQEEPVRMAAIQAAANAGKLKALPALIAHLEEAPDADQKAAEQVMARMSEKGALDEVAKGLSSVKSPKARATLLLVLGARKSFAHKDAVLAATSDPEIGVRVAAFKALDDLAEEKDLPRLIELLVAAKKANEVAAAQKAVVAVAGRIEDAEKRADALLDAMGKVSGEDKAAILGAIAKVGGKKALGAVAAETRNASSPAYDAAVRALSEWADIEAAPELLRVAEEAADSKFQALAIRGVLRLGGEKGVPAGKKFGLFKKALKAAKRDEEKKAVIGALADVRTSASLKVVMEHLDNNAIAKDVAVAFAAIACPKDKKDSGVVEPGFSAAMEKAASLLDDEEMAKKAKRHLVTLKFYDDLMDTKTDSEGFMALFNGKDMSGWTGKTQGYEVKDGVVICTSGTKDKIYTEQQFSDYELRFEFKLTPGANNGLGVRTPAEGNPAYEGMELQILDDTADKYKDLKPYQFHGSVYGVVPSKKGHLKPVGEWNTQEVILKGSKVKVVLNGTAIVDADLNEASKSGTVDGQNHPGLKRSSGHIALLAHGDEVHFRNMRIREILNEAPDGFTALFNGKDLAGWKGLVDDPIKRSGMSEYEMSSAQRKADAVMNAHWRVVNGVLVFDGQGQSLCTAKDYANFEMLVDWKITPGGDSGIYLRGSPQVQIWDPKENPVGSGGLYNNQKETSSPLVCADNPVGQWNTFRIKMAGEKVTVHLNDKLVVDNVTLENYWDRSKPIFPTGQIELQNHHTPLCFRNVYIKELP